MAPRMIGVGQDDDKSAYLGIKRISYAEEEDINVDKAIEIKSRTGEEFLGTDPDEIDEAERLSIEALAYIKRSRTFGEYPVCQQLPGETSV